MTLSFDELVSPRPLDVPDYQRGYAWEGEHLREFWEDLDLIEPGRRHYTGTVVLRDRRRSLLDQEREVPLGHFDVVDGQQRLTTCALLLDRVYDHLEALHDGDVPGERRRLLTAVIDGVRRPKLQLGADLQEYWQRVILDGRPQVDGPVLAAQRRLSQAAEFVEDRLATARTQHADDSAYRTWLRRLAGKVTSALQFTLYVVDNDSDVGVIFETLNQRGKELTELEKTKNYLLYLANLLDDGPRRQLAAAINESWRTIFVNLGSAQLGPAHEDQLLRAHWLATQDPRQREWEKIRSVKKQFHRSKYREDKPLLLKEVTAYAYSLREASAAYRDIVTDSPESFAAYGADAADVRKRSRQLRQAGVVQIFAPLLIAARLRFPADGKAWRNWYAKPGHKYFLYQYELHLLGGAAPLYGFEHFTRGEFRASTTEHVLPQTPTSKCWRVFSAENRALYTNCLGNLVLTNDNRVYFNYCFTRKRDGITAPDGKTTPSYRTSVLKQEQELATFDEWTPAQVRQRQDILAQWAIKRWELGPNQPLTTVAALAVTGEEDLDDADTDPMLASNPEDDIG